MEIEIPYDELLQIQRDYHKRRYTHLVDCLKQFLINNSEKILQLKEHVEKREGKYFLLEDIIGLFILDNKTVDFRLDMEDQTEEVMKEKWIRHEKNSNEPVSQIEMDWVRKYAAAWRIHRVREIMYVFSQNKQEYLELVK